MLLIVVGLLDVWLFVVFVCLFVGCPFVCLMGLSLHCLFVGCGYIVVFTFFQCFYWYNVVRYYSIGVCLLVRMLGSI